MSRFASPRTLVALAMFAGSAFVVTHALATAPNPMTTGDAAGITKTLLPEVALRVLRLQQALALPYATITSTKHHTGDTNDCLSCHSDEKGSLPADHGKKNGLAAWPIESCERCHLREEKLGAARVGAVSLDVADNAYCVACHANPMIKKDYPAAKATSLFVDQEHYAGSTHGRVRVPCVGCHDIGPFPHENSHFRDSRELARHVERSSCMACHPTETDTFRTSIHGQSYFERDNVDVPGCTDCHGAHATGSSKEPSARLAMVDTCTRCHSDASLAKRYGFSPNVTRTYVEEFHGATVRLTRNLSPEASTNKPVCHDCHGAHEIKKLSDLNANAAKGSVVLMCQKCHKQAGVRFAGAWTGHETPSLEKAPIVYLTQLSYKVLIPAVMGPFGLYMLFEMARFGLDRLRERRRP